jgi:hypothetical protein
MTLEQRIKNLAGSLIVRDDADLVHEIRGFHDILDDVAYREKIRSAIRWAEIYINPQQYAAWDSEAESGREAVRQFLFGDQGEAANIARKACMT